MKVAEIAGPELVTIPAEAVLETAMALMDEYEIRHLPVVEDGKLVGVLSSRDVLNATGWSTERARHDAKTARDTMRTPVETIRSGDTIVAAAVGVVLDGVGCLPVIDDKDDSLVGIITEVDLLRAFCDDCRRDKFPDDDPFVTECMTKDVRSIAPGTTLKEALDLCRKEDIHHLPIVHEGEFVSFVSDRTLRAARGLGRPETTPVATLMTEHSVRVQPGARLSDAARSMHECKVTGLPVVRGQELVGVITTKDIIEHYGNTLWKANDAVPG